MELEPISLFVRTLGNVMKTPDQEENETAAKRDRAVEAQLTRVTLLLRIDTRPLCSCPVRTLKIPFGWQLQRCERGKARLPPRGLLLRFVQTVFSIHARHSACAERDAHLMHRLVCV